MTRITCEDVEANVKLTFFFSAYEGALGAAAASQVPEYGKLARFEFNSTHSMHDLIFCVIVLSDDVQCAGWHILEGGEDREDGESVAYECALRNAAFLFNKGLKKGE